MWTSKQFVKVWGKSPNFILKLTTQALLGAVPQLNCRISSGFCTCSTFAYREVKGQLRLYRGKGCTKVFCKHIRSEANRLYNMFPERPMKRLTQEEWREFNGATMCHICFNDFEEDDNFNYKVRDHCHYMGLY